MGVSSLAAYNGSGTQGTAVTNTITTSDDGDVQSVFWNANDTTRVLLFGSSINDIPSTGGMGATWGGNQVFTVNNDLDALGDLYLTVGMSFDNSLSSSTETPATRIYQNGLIYFIKRVEFMVGTQVWQTLETADILAANVTEKTEGEYHSIQLGAMCCNRSDGTQLFGPTALHLGEVYADGKKSSVTFKLPVLTKTLASTFEKFADNTEDGYLMAAAPHQQVKVKVYFADNGQSIFVPGQEEDGATQTQLGATSWTTTDRNYGDWTVSLLGKHQIMCNAERQQLKNMPQGLPKRIKMTQNAVQSVDTFTNKTPFVVDLDHFSLYASYLVVSCNVERTASPFAGNSGLLSMPYSESTIDIGGGSTTTLPGQYSSFGLSKGSYIGLESCELLLNSTSISGVLMTDFLTACATDSLGLNFNRMNLLTDYNFDRSIYRKAGSAGPTLQAVPGSLPLKVLDPNTTYIFPLSSHAYDGSAIPLNRFDNIRLRCVPTKFRVDGSSDTIEGGKVTVNVTCFGETTALYRGGAASLAMY